MRLRTATSLLLSVSFLMTFGCARLEFTDGGDNTPPPPPPPPVCELQEATPYCPPYGTQCYDNSVYACDDECGHPVGNAQRVCGNDERCDTDGIDAFCRPCEEGECQEEDDTPPEPTECDGTNTQPFCTSWNTHMRCQADGTWSSESTCPASQRCNRGYCAGGAQPASRCANDGVCSGGFCICGAGYTASNPSECLAGMSLGFCSNRSCLTDGCPDTQHCASFLGRSQARGGSICLPKNNCTQRGQACTVDSRQLTCSEVPVKAEGADGPTTWALSCFTMTLKEIGDTCTSNAECVGGNCLLTNVGSTPVRYCAAPCERDDECPSYAACVQPAGQANPLCLRRADDCSERLSAEPGIVTQTLNDRDEEPVDVCYFQQ